VPEQQGAGRGGQGQRHGLGEVGADQLPGRQHGVEEQHHHDHQRAGADRRHADDDAADGADADGQQGLGGDLLDPGQPLMAAAPVEDVAQHHGTGPDEQGRAEHGLDPVLGGQRLGRRAVPEQVQQVGADEGHRHRAAHQPADQLEVDGALADVDGGAEGPHDHGGDQVTGDRGGRLDPEQQNEHRSHQGPAAGPGQADQETHDRAAQNDVGIDVQCCLRGSGTESIHTVPASFMGNKT